MTYKEFTKRTGKLIRTYRIRKGFKLKDLARELNVDYQRIQNYENGKYLPRFYTMVTIAEILEIPANAIFYGEADDWSKTMKKSKKK